MSFAALQTRVNATAIKRLGESVIVDGVNVMGLFENATNSAVHSQIGYEHAAPTLTVDTAAVPIPAVGVEVTIGNDDYTVYAHEPDGAGLSRLLLERRV